jgi:hypothetical protein
MSIAAHSFAFRIRSIANRGVRFQALGLAATP